MTKIFLVFWFLSGEPAVLEMENSDACHKGVEYLEKQGAEAFCSWYYGGEA